VRGYSFYGFSFRVRHLFEDGTTTTGARSPRLEYLNGLTGGLPQACSPSSARTRRASAGPSCIPSIPPIATSPNLRSYAGLVTCVTNLASVKASPRWPSIGGFVRQYQVHGGPDEAARLQPLHLRSRDGGQAQQRRSRRPVRRALEKEFILRVRGYVNKLDDLRKVTVGLGDRSTQFSWVRLADVQFGPDMRRRHCRAQRPGRDGRRRRSGALWRQRAPGDSWMRRKLDYRHEGFTCPT